MTDDLASARLSDLLIMLQQTLRPPCTPHSSNNTSHPSDDFLQVMKKQSASFNKGCTPLKVFGCEHGGVLPATYCQDPNHQVCYSYHHASSLNPTSRTSWLSDIYITTLSWLLLEPTTSLKFVWWQSFRLAWRTFCRLLLRRRWRQRRLLRQSWRRCFSRKRLLTVFSASFFPSVLFCTDMSFPTSPYAFCYCLRMRALTYP